VVIGGLISSTVMTLLVLPSIYALLAGRGGATRERAAEASGSS